MTNSIQELKQEAVRLRAALELSDKQVSHAQSLELVARQKGYRNWNTAVAMTGNQAIRPPVQIGQKVEGAYLGQRFTARVLGLHSRVRPDHWRITLDMDDPVDVVTFESFSSMRKRVSATIDASGRTIEKTSNGLPHLVLDVI